MKLLLKFNLVFVAVFLLGIGLTGLVTRELLARNAQEEVLQHARFMMEKALAVRSYTSTQVAPLLETQMKYSFLPQSVPAFSATEVLAKLAEELPRIQLQGSDDQPHEPAQPCGRMGSRRDLGVRKSPKRRNSSASATRPPAARCTSRGRSSIANEACLRCHSTVEAAPKTLVEKYGPANGFGWHLGEVVGAQMVSVPMACRCSAPTAPSASSWAC